MFHLIDGSNWYPKVTAGPIILFNLQWHLVLGESHLHILIVLVTCSGTANLIILFNLQWHLVLGESCLHILIILVTCSGTASLIILFNLQWHLVLGESCLQCSTNFIFGEKTETNLAASVSR